MPVTPERSGRLAEAIALARPATVDELYWLARITLVSDPADIGLFDRVFRQLFGGLWDPSDSRGDTNAPPPVSSRMGDSRSRDGEDRPGGQSASPNPTPSLPGEREGDDDAGDDAAESKAASGFVPSTGGMASALPHVDRLVSGHTLAAIDELLAAIAE